MKLFQLKDGYRYNSDSLFLWDFFCNNSKIKAGQSLLDVGCGCGILGLLIARDFGCDLTSIDIQPQNCELAQRNATENGINASVICADFLSFDFGGMSFEMIISNPPFYDFGMSSQNKHKNTSRSALGFDIRAFARICARILKGNGELVFCYDARLIDRVFVALNEAGLKPVKLEFIHSKAPKPAKLALIKAKKNSKTPLEILPSKFSFEGQSFAPWASEVFKKADLLSVDLADF